MCHGHNFHHRDLKFSDIVPDTIIFNHKLKKRMMKIELPPNTVPGDHTAVNNFFIIHFRENVFVSEDFLSTIKKNSYIKQTGIWGHSRK